MRGIFDTQNTTDRDDELRVSCRYCDDCGRLRSDVKLRRINVRVLAGPRGVLSVTRALCLPCLSGKGNP